VSDAVRRAAPDDADLLARHRASVWHEVGDHSLESMKAQVPIWSAWFRDALADGTYVSYIVERDGEAIASGSLLVHVAIPRPGSPSDREGRVQSVYVVPHARRGGVARSLMAEIMAYARAAMLIRLTLHPSDEARPLYAALGFEDLDEMGLRLTAE
jgi:GNAT superfamily N-acetyltransferase